MKTLQDFCVAILTDFQLSTKFNSEVYEKFHQLKIKNECGNVVSSVIEQEKSRIKRNWIGYKYANNMNNSIVTYNCRHVIQKISHVLQRTRFYQRKIPKVHTNDDSIKYPDIPILLYYILPDYQRNKGMHSREIYNDTRTNAHGIFIMERTHNYYYPNHIEEEKEKLKSDDLEITMPIVVWMYWIILGASCFYLYRNLIR